MGKAKSKAKHSKNIRIPGDKQGQPHPSATKLVTTAICTALSAALSAAQLPAEERLAAAKKRWQSLSDEQRHQLFVVPNQDLVESAAFLASAAQSRWPQNILLCCTACQHHISHCCDAHDGSCAYIV